MSPSATPRTPEPPTESLLSWFKRLIAPTPNRFPPIATALQSLLSALLLSPYSPLSSNANPEHVFETVNATQSPFTLPPEFAEYLSLINSACEEYGEPPVVLGELTPPLAFATDEANAKRITAAAWAWFTINGLVSFAIAGVFYLTTQKKPATENDATLTSTADTHEAQQHSNLFALIKNIRTYLGSSFVLYKVMAAIRGASNDFHRDLADIQQWQPHCSAVTYEAYQELFSGSQLLALYLNNCSDYQRQYFIAPTIRPYATGMMAFMVNVTSVDALHGVVILAATALLRHPRIRNHLLKKIPTTNAASEEERNNTFLKVLLNALSTSLPVILSVCSAYLAFSIDSPQADPTCNTWSDATNKITCNGTIASSLSANNFIRVSSHAITSGQEPCRAWKTVEFVVDNQSAFHTGFAMDCINSAPYNPALLILLAEVSHLYKTVFLGAPLALIMSLALATTLAAISNACPSVQQTCSQGLHNVADLTRTAIRAQGHLLKPIYITALGFSLYQALNLLAPEEANLSGVISFFSHFISSICLTAIGAGDIGSLFSAKQINIQSTTQLFTWAEKIIFVMVGFVPAAIPLLAFMSRSQAHRPDAESNSIADLESGSDSKCAHLLATDDGTRGDETEPSHTTAANSTFGLAGFWTSLSRTVRAAKLSSDHSCSIS